MMKMSIVVMSLSLTFFCQTSNPVKMSMLLLIISGTAFARMAWKTGLTWFPILFFLLFMGGILLMFMILSSILPNQEWKSIKISNFLSFLLFAVLCAISFKQKMGPSSNQMKSFLSTSNSMVFLTVVLMIYFFSSISVVSKEENPMREIYC